MSWTRQRETDPAVVLPEVELDPGRAELGVLVRDHLGELGGGTDDDPGVPVERAVGGPALRTLVDVAGDRGDAVGGLVILGDPSLAGERDRADGDRRAVGVELPQSFRVARTPAALSRCWRVSSKSSIEWL